MRATEDIPSPAFSSMLVQLTAALLTVFRVLTLARNVAKRYLRVLEALEEKKQAQAALYEFYFLAAIVKYDMESNHEAMFTFVTEFERAVQHVTTTTGASK
jgi:hypothetical protein